MLEPKFDHFTVKSLVAFAMLMSTAFNVQGQPVPSEEENIPFLMTFGNKADTSWGDDDFSQTFFFVVPESYKGMVFIRVFDPDTGGKWDELNGAFDTKMQYSVYGGKEAFSHPDAQGTDPVGNYKSGTLLATKTFGVDPKVDNNWYTFGPFNPTAGEFDPQYGGYMFKVICDGITGDDGNMYRYFMSTSATANIPIEGGNAFSFEYSFRMHDNPKEVSHIYPYVDMECTKIRQGNFDWDNDGVIRVISEVRREQFCTVSGDNVWAQSEFAIIEGEKGKSLDFQFIKKGIKNNNVVINVRNQRGDLLKFYSSPIGGVPKYKYNIGSTKTKAKK
ncbi:MAG: hypothetical protein LBL24_05590 [Bacteroidales bacterium]|jgi:hypothetical protein|nr:hypothetical protein [Bacteroidales bacterium]